MGSRLNLQTLLENILESRNVYYQPPASVKMRYPAIRYELSGIDILSADNAVYNQNKSYELTLIDPEIETPYLEKLASLSKCSFNRFYRADSLNHWVFTLYY